MIGYTAFAGHLNFARRARVTLTTGSGEPDASDGLPEIRLTWCLRKNDVQSHLNCRRPLHICGRWGEAFGAPHFISGGNLTDTPGYGALIAPGNADVVRQISNPPIEVGNGHRP